MKNRFMFLLLISCIACEQLNDSSDYNDASKLKVFKAEYAESKTVLEDDGRVFWVSGDRITVFSNGEGSEFATEDNGPVADFTGFTTETGNTYYALYPASTSASLDGNAISTVLPTNQPAVPGTFATMLAPSVAITSTENLYFRNTASLVKFQLSDTETDVKSVVLRGNNNEKLSGEISIDCSKSAPQATVAETGADFIELSAGEGKVLTPGESYYFVVPPVLFSKGIKLELNTITGEVKSKSSTNELNLLRSRISNLGVITGEKMQMATISGISPLRGGAGSIVTIKGTNFIYDDKDLNAVTCGGVTLEVIDVKNGNEMNVRIPSGLDKFDYIELRIPGQEKASVSPEKFRYDAAMDYDWGYKGISYGAVNMSIPLTKGAVDSMSTMGVSFITIRSGYGESEGLATGIIPSSKNVILDNVVKIKKYSDGKIKTVFTIEHNKNLGGAGYPKVTEASISKFFDNLKAHTFEGMSAWDCIDGIQLFGNTNHLTSNTTKSAVEDFIEHVLKPIYRYVHPEGFCKTGEKLVLGVPAMIEDKTALINPEVLNSTGYKNWIDVYMMLFNQGNPGGTEYYSLSLPENIFDGRWNNLAIPAVNSDPENPVTFMNIDLNINGPTARFQKVDDLGRALAHIIRLMGENPLYKGYAYRSFLENNVGIRSQTNKLDPRTPDNKETPQISFYDMYTSLPAK